MTDNLDTATDVTKTVAKELGKVVVVSAAQTAAAYAGAIASLAVIGFALKKRDERRANKAVTLTEVK